MASLTTYQIQELIKSVDSLQKDIKQIREIDLPALREDNTATKTRMNVFTAFNIGAIILGIIGARILK